MDENLNLPLKYSTRLPFKTPVRSFGPAFPRKKFTRALISAGAVFCASSNVTDIRLVSDILIEVIKFSEMGDEHTTCQRVARDRTKSELANLTVSPTQANKILDNTTKIVQVIIFKNLFQPYLYTLLQAPAIVARIGSGPVRIQFRCRRLREYEHCDRN